MIALLNVVRSVEQLADYPNNVDLHELLQSAVVQANTRLWPGDERLIAFALVDEFNNLLFDCQPEKLNELGDDIVQWGSSRLNRGAKTLDTNCRESDTTRVVFLEKHGFVRTPTETIFMRRNLDEPIPIPALPAGFIIRPIKGEEEAGPLAELHRLAFGKDHITTEKRITWMRVPEYDASLDLVVTAPDGTFAAYCMCSINNERDQLTGILEGQTDPVATHPRYQRLGLARALLSTGLHLLKERGMKMAGLGTSGDNIAMQKTALSIGFYITHKKIWFEKAIK